MDENREPPNVLLREPSDEEVRQFLSAQGKLPFSYGEVGVSREDETADLPPSIPWTATA